ncbi:hypothetical protein QU39_00030, partial [Staphylococcus aureus]
AILAADIDAIGSEAEHGQHGQRDADAAAQAPAVHAEGVKDTAENQRRAGPPQPDARSRRQLDQGEQHENQRHIFDEVELRAHAADESVVAAIADKDLFGHAEPGDSQGQPEIDHGGGAGGAERHGK